jgi:hypothetical protein
MVEPYLINSNNYEPGYYRVSAYGGNVWLTVEQWIKYNIAAFTCPSGTSARGRAANGVPIWQSHYFGDWNNLRLYPGSGTYHGVDLLMLFSTAENVSEVANTEEEPDFAHYMASAWVASASDPHEGLTNFGWPQYNHDRTFTADIRYIHPFNIFAEGTLVGLAYKNGKNAEFLRPWVVETSCASLKGNSTYGKGARFRHLNDVEKPQWKTQISVHHFRNNCPFSSLDGDFIDALLGADITSD